MDPHLVPVRPKLFGDRTCPSCGSSEVDALGTVFPGVHVLGEYKCRTCGYAFYHDLPVGFAVDHDVAIGKEYGQLHNPKGAADWVWGPLMEGFHAPSDLEVKIERRVLREHKRVVVLNTLDFLYGHVLLKLWNAQYYLDAHPDLGLVLILPRSFEWLVPKGTAEVWLVDQRLGQAHGWFKAIDRFVQAQLPNYDEVFLGKGYAHPDKSKVDMERFSGVAPFPLEKFMERPRRITFVLREDRLWLRSPFFRFMHRALNKVGLKELARGVFLADQERLAFVALRGIRAHYPDVKATIVGLGERGGDVPGVDDLRTRKMDKDTELRWCAAYAESQVVIGVHGSNMLLPTALSAGCIEILPYDRYGNIVQDVAVRYNDVMQLFLYRFVDEFSSSKAVARHAVSMFKDFPVYYRNNRINIH